MASPTQVVERVGAVDLGLALAEQVQVRAGEQQDRGHAGSAFHVGVDADGANATSSARAGGSSTRLEAVGPGSTNVSPPLAFLSRRIDVEQLRRDRVGPGTAVGRPSDGDDVAVAVDGVGVDALERAGERAREHEPDRDRLAVQQLVAADGLERVARACGRRLSVARSPVRSCGSAATTSALIAAHAATRSVSTSGSRATIAVGVIASTMRGRRVVAAAA